MKPVELWHVGWPASTLLPWRPPFLAGWELRKEGPCRFYQIFSYSQQNSQGVSSHLELGR